MIVHILMFDNWSNPIDSHSIMTLIISFYVLEVKVEGRLRSAVEDLCC